MIRVTQHRQRCIGCNACIEAAPYRWKMSHTDGKSVLIGARPARDAFTLVTTDDEWADQKRAAANCPVGIIRVEKT